jgi:hypothetical protein
VAQNKYSTVWLDGASHASTCIPSSLNFSRITFYIKTKTKNLESVFETHFGKE